MRKTMRSLKVLGVSVMAALGLMAFTASAAHAETELKVNGTLLKANETFTGVNQGTYLLIIPSRNLVLHCAKRLFEGYLYLWIPRRWDIVYLYENCTALTLAGVSVPKCDVAEYTIKAEASAFLHNSKTYMLFGPEKGGVLGEIEFGELCALTETVELTGSWVEECVEVSCETEAVSHKMAVASSKLFTTDALKFGEVSATLEGSAEVQLSGANKGQKWSVVE